MIKTFMASIFLLLSNAVLSLAANQTSTQPGQSTFISRDQALSCIRINLDINLSNQQAITTQNKNALLKSKIHYIEQQILKRRQLIEKLDRKSGQENNANYNQLIIQFESLVDERKLSIALYKKGVQRQFTQQQSTTRLENRLSHQCESNIKISLKMHQDVCKSVAIHWCDNFKL